PPATWSYSAATTGVARCATPGPGTARPGQSRPPRPARPPGYLRRWPTTRPPATWSCSAASPPGPAPSTTPGPAALADPRVSLAYHRCPSPSPSCSQVPDPCERAPSPGSAEPIACDGPPGPP